MFRCYFSDLVLLVTMHLVILARLVVVSCGLLLFCVAVVWSLGGSACGFLRLLFFVTVLRVYFLFCVLFCYVF